jgi:hypothetical protein
MAAIWQQSCLQVSTAARRPLLASVAQAADEAGCLLAASVLQLLGSCGRTHSPADILQASAHVADSESGNSALHTSVRSIFGCGLLLLMLNEGPSTSSSSTAELLLCTCMYH